MSYSYWLHEKIQKDLNEGFVWYEERRAGLGYKFLQAVKLQLKKLSPILKYMEAKGIQILKRH